MPPLGMLGQQAQQPNPLAGLKPPQAPLATADGIQQMAQKAAHSTLTHCKTGAACALADARPGPFAAHLRAKYAASEPSLSSSGTSPVSSSGGNAPSSTSFGVDSVGTASQPAPQPMLPGNVGANAPGAPNAQNHGPTQQPNQPPQGAGGPSNAGVGAFGIVRPGLSSPAPGFPFAHSIKAAAARFAM
jgi:hypothetical protein